MKNTLLIFTAMFLSSCSTPGKVQEIETKDFTQKGSAVSGKIGLNSKDVIVIREVTSAQDELMTLDFVNTHLRGDVERELYELRACETQLNDPRLGGNGQPVSEHEIELRTPEFETKMGMDEEGELRVVREHSFEERLKVEKEYSFTLKRMKKLASTQNESCKQKLSMIREKNGLPGQPYRAKGYFTNDGTWVETQRGEMTLDDAFAIRSRMKSKHKGGDL